MSFIWIHMLWLLLLIPLIVVAYILIQRRRKKYVLRYASLSLVKEALGRTPGKRRHIPAILFLIGLTAITLAISRPAATIFLPSNQGTVILTIDVSGSMRADDLKPSRIEAAKSAAKLFIEKQPKNVRIGIISFSESAAVIQSPTTDREQLLNAISRLTPQRGTAIGRGLLASIDTIFEEPASKPAQSPRDPLSTPSPKLTPTPVPAGNYASAVIVLLSDGQSNSGPRPLEIIDQVKSRGVRVYTVGIGSSEGTVLRFNEFAIRVRLDEDTLKSIAERTDGLYFKAGGEDDLQKIYENLSTRIVFKPEQTELTAFFSSFAAFVLSVAGILSMLWFNRLP